MKKFFYSISAFFSVLNVVLMPFRKGGNKQFLVFLLFLFISTMFWFLQSLNNKENINILLPLEYVNVPKDVIFATEPPDVVNVQLRDKGVNLINYSLGRINPVEIDLSLFSPKRERVVITREKLIPIISEELKSSTELVTLYSDSLVLIYAGKEGVEKPVKLNSDVTISYNCIRNDSTIIRPSSVTVYADSSILSSIDEVETELLILKEVSDTTVVKLKLKEIYGTKIEPNEVEVVVPIEELISKRLSLPIGQINFPDNISVITFPANADIDVMIPMSQFPQTDNSKFRLNVDYRQYKYNNQKLPLVLTKVPDYIERISIIPDSVEYIIERKDIERVPKDSLIN